MKLEPIVFQDNSDPINRFATLLEKLQRCCPIIMETDRQRRVVRPTVAEKVPSGKGVSVFHEDGKNLYVGRTDQMADRLLNHGRKPHASAPSSATFALILAKNEFKKAFLVPHNLFSKELARELNAHADVKLKLWQEAVERVKRMSVKVVEIEHPHEQAVFEIYVHEKLGTPFNSFVNH